MDNLLKLADIVCAYFSAIGNRPLPADSNRVEETGNLLLLVKGGGRHEDDTCLKSRAFQFLLERTHGPSTLPLVLDTLTLINDQKNSFLSNGSEAFVGEAIVKGILFHFFSLLFLYTQHV